MLGAEPKRFVALLAAVLVAVCAASARADAVPGSYSGHGISFSYPSDWLNLPATIEVQQGTPLWTESFAPIPQAPAPAPGSPTPPATQPSAPMSTDLVIIAAYHLPFSITKKNIARYRNLVRVSTQVLLAQAGGQLVSGPTRISMGKLPGYRVDATATFANTAVDNRLVFGFRGHSEYFLNCENTHGGPLTAEIQSGCDQIMHTFRLAP